MALTYAQLPQSANCVGYWQLGEASGATRLDSSPNGNHLTDHNTVTQQTGHEASGTVKAAGFTGGGSNWLDHADTAVLDKTGAFTLLGWMRPIVLAGGTNNALVSKGHESAANANYYIIITDTGSSHYALFARVSADGSSVGPGQTTGGTNTLAINTWYMFGMVYIPSTSVTVYLNGAQDGQVTSSVPASLFNGSAGFEIGRNTASGTNFWDHYTQSVALWNVALSGSDITTFYNETVPASGNFFQLM